MYGDGDETPTFFDIQFLTRQRTNQPETAAAGTNLKTMKKFITLLFAADVATSTAQPLTSETLVKLRNEKKALWAEMVKHEDPDTDEAKNASLAVHKKQGEINAEEANLRKIASDAEITAKRNERLKLAQNLIDAVTAKLTAPKNTPADKMAEFDGAIATAREIVENELLAKFAASKPAKVAADGATPKSDGGANKEAILELARSGKTQKEIIEAGYKRSTVWHTVNNAKIAGETFANA